MSVLSLQLKFFIFQKKEDADDCIKMLKAQNENFSKKSK